MYGKPNIDISIMQEDWVLSHRMDNSFILGSTLDALGETELAKLALHAYILLSWAANRV